MENHHATPIERKTIFQYLCYFGSVVASHFLGWFNRISIVAAYPYSNPQPQGWAGLATFLGMYGIIGGFSLKKLKTDPVKKRSIWILIATFCAGLIFFIVGFAAGVKNPDYFTSGTYYGVYGHQLNSNRKK